MTWLTYAVPHLPVPDPDAPGCCQCHLPLRAGRHLDTPPEVPAEVAALEARRLGERDEADRGRGTHPTRPPRPPRPRRKPTTSVALHVREPHPYAPDPVVPADASGHRPCLCGLPHASAQHAPPPG
jgi:hypothetical protein